MKRGVPRSRFEKTHVEKRKKEELSALEREKEKKRGLPRQTLEL